METPLCRTAPPPRSSRGSQGSSVLSDTSHRPVRRGKGGTRLSERNGKCMVLFYISRMRVYVCKAAWQQSSSSSGNASREEKLDLEQAQGTNGLVRYLRLWRQGRSRSLFTLSLSLAHTVCMETVACLNISNNKLPPQCMDERSNHALRVHGILMHVL